MENTASKTISELVAADYRTAAVFKNHGIDFCCRGGRTIDQACDKQHVSVTDLLADLERLAEAGEQEPIDYQSWPMDRLIGHIEKKHHRYILDTAPMIDQYLDKLCKVHGGRYPELFEINREFKAAASELAMHMQKEEYILFPYIRQMAEAEKNGEQTVQPGFGSVENPIAIMKEEHIAEGDRFSKMSAFSNSYNPPADACNTYKVAYALLQEFEDDLHMHIHLENNILFPKAIDKERALSGLPA